MPLNIATVRGPLLRTCHITNHRGRAQAAASGCIRRRPTAHGKHDVVALNVLSHLLGGGDKLLHSLCHIVGLCRVHIVHYVLSMRREIQQLPQSEAFRSVVAACIMQL